MCFAKRLLDIRYAVETVDGLLCSAIELFGGYCQPMLLGPEFLVPVIVAILTVGGTILGTFAINKHTQIREKKIEAAIVRSAILADVETIIDAMTRQVEMDTTSAAMADDPMNPVNVHIPKWGRQIVFEAILPKIGLLGEALSKDIIYAYKCLLNLDRVSRLGFAAGISVNEPDGTITTTLDSFKDYQKMMLNMKQRFEKLRDDLKNN